MLDGVSLVVPPRARIGLVGPNGIGKSTLLRILAGLDEPDAGRVRGDPPSLLVGYSPQEPDARPGETVLAYLARRTGAARQGGLGVDKLPVRFASVCAEVGLQNRLIERVGSLSGGEAARAMLAAVLLGRFDVCLLDEPTNNLDFAGLDLLERFLRDFRGAAVIVSHDRAFLDRTVTRIVELDEGTHRVIEYRGGWQEYEAARARAVRRHYDAFATYQSDKARLEERLRERRDWVVRAGCGQRRKKKSRDLRKRFEHRIERLEKVEKPFEPWQLRLDLGYERRSGDVVVRLQGATVERGGFSLGPVDLEIGRRDRLAIVGPNGSGKTTLLQALLGRLPLAAGVRYVGPGVVLGELEQARASFSGGQLLATFVDASGLAAEAARTLLAKFGLGADDVLRSGSSLSAGERTRASLALLAALGVNCLALDEPTNHLDVPAIEELEAGVEGFGGTVLLVTHDRSFLERFRATRTLELPPSPAPAARAGARRPGDRRARAPRATSS